MKRCFQIIEQQITGEKIQKKIYSGGNQWRINIYFVEYVKNVKDDF